MNKERLTILADGLEKIDDEHFNLNAWGVFRGEDGLILETADLVTEDEDADDAPRLTMEEMAERSGVPIDCGMTACAVGHGCMIPELKEQGLNHFIVYDEMVPTFGGYEGWAAIQMFFGLTPEEAHYLFDDRYYGPRNDKSIDVRTRIREVIQNGFPSNDDMVDVGRTAQKEWEDERYPGE